VSASLSVGELVCRRVVQLPFNTVLNSVLSAPCSKCIKAEHWTCLQLLSLVCPLSVGIPLYFMYMLSGSYTNKLEYRAIKNRHMSHVPTSDILVLKLISVLVFILFSSQNFYFI